MVLLQFTLFPLGLFLGFRLRQLPVNAPTIDSPPIEQLCWPKYAKQRRNERAVTSVYKRAYANFDGSCSKRKKPSIIWEVFSLSLIMETRLGIFICNPWKFCEHFDFKGRAPFLGTVVDGTRERKKSVWRDECWKNSSLCCLHKCIIYFCYTVHTLFSFSIQRRAERTWAGGSFVVVDLTGEGGIT